MESWLVPLKSSGWVACGNSEVWGHISRILSKFGVNFSFYLLFSFTGSNLKIAIGRHFGMKLINPRVGGVLKIMVTPGSRKLILSFNIFDWQPPLPEMKGNCTSNQIEHSNCTLSQNYQHCLENTISILQGFFSKFLMGGGGLKIFGPRRSPTVTKSDGGGTCEKNPTEAKIAHLMQN